MHNQTHIPRRALIHAWSLQALTLATLLSFPSQTLAQSPFATQVISYRPAPGQFVQDPAFNNPLAALGPPIGAGTFDGDSTKAVTLGGFGGTLVLGFDHTILDDPRNPLGLDCIVFANAFWATDNPNRRWGEPATIEIALDTNANGLADDPWFLIPGSHLPNPPALWQSQTWDDDVNDPTHPPEHSWWIPPGEQGQWQTWAYRLPQNPFENSLILENPNGQQATEEGIWGYADCSPTLILGDMNSDNTIDNYDITPDRFYTSPDNPFAVGIDPGSGGGDAFDIAWAIDPQTNQTAALPGFDFIRFTNATNVLFGPFGERSAEICGVADVPPTPHKQTQGMHAPTQEIRRP